MRVLSTRHAMHWLGNPRNWFEVVRRVHRARRGRAWCQVEARRLDESLVALCLEPPPAAFEALYASVVRSASERTQECPVRLGGGGNMTLLYWLCEQLEATRVLETGVAYGWSSLAILMSLSNRRSGLLVSTDLPYPFAGTEMHGCVGLAVPESLHHCWRLLRQPDEEVLKALPDRVGSVDVAHHDSDKTHEGRLWAYPRMWECLRPGGVLVCDDAGDNLAFRDFADSIQVPPVIVGDGQKFQGLLRKPGSPGHVPGRNG